MTTPIFKRGEVRKLSIELVERYSAEPFETVVELTSEAFGFTKEQARTHIRWLVREGLVNKTDGINAWPKRARKVKVEKVAKKAAKKAKKTTSKSTKVSKTPAVETVAAAVTEVPAEPTGIEKGMNKSMAALAAKFSQFRKDKATEAA